MTLQQLRLEETETQSYNPPWRAIECAQGSGFPHSMNGPLAGPHEQERPVLADERLNGHEEGEIDFANLSPIVPKDDDNGLAAFVEEFRALNHAVGHMRTDHLRLKQSLSLVVDSELLSMGSSSQEDVGGLTADDAPVTDYDSPLEVEHDGFYRPGTPFSAPGDLDRRWTSRNVAAEEPRHHRRSWPLSHKEFLEYTKDLFTDADEESDDSQSYYEMDMDEGEDAPFIPDDPPIVEEPVLSTADTIQQMPTEIPAPSWQPAFGLIWLHKKATNRRRYPIPRVRNTSGDFMSCLSCLAVDGRVDIYNHLLDIPTYAQGLMSGYLATCFFWDEDQTTPQSSVTSVEAQSYTEVTVLEVPEEDEQKMMQRMNCVWSPYPPQLSIMHGIYSTDSDKIPFHYPGIAHEPVPQ